MEEKVLHPKTADIATNVYAEARHGISAPFQLPAWTNALFVPEDRIWCVDCKRPIPINAERCPFCDSVNPPDPDKKIDYDSDKDGIPDWWEKKYGLDPNDPGDALKDNDGDGFSNLEEYLGGTDPNDPNSYPPVENKLRVTRIAANPFNLQFKGVMRLPDGNQKFQLNLKGNIKTYFVKMNEEVEGFKVVKYVPKIEEQDVEGIHGKQKVDVSELTLQRGDKEILLQLGRAVPYSEHVAELLFTVDNSTHRVKMGSEFDLKDKKYKVLGIDSKQATVVIERLFDHEQFTIHRVPERDREGTSRQGVGTRTGEGDKLR